MYAIINDGAHQYRVEEGMVFEVQRKELPEGTKSVTFDRVLFVGDTGGAPKVGQPLVAGASVTASVVEEIKGDKIFIQKFRRRKNYARKTGHRQRFLQVKVEKITA